MVITENGMKFTVEDAKSAQAIAYVQSELFREYSLQQDGSTAMFRVNLPVLMVSACQVTVCRHVYTHTHTHTYMHTHTYTCAHTHTYTHMCARTHIHTHVRAHTHTHTRTHTHTHTLDNSVL